MIANRGNTRRDFYKKRLTQKSQELAAIESQLEGVLSNVDELKLTNQAECLMGEIEELDQKLSKLEATNPNSNPNTRHLNLEKSFQKIDFSEAKRITRSINSRFGDASGAILLFLQRSTKQKGNYCLNEVLDLLVTDRKVGGQMIGYYRKYEIDLDSPISEFNEIEFAKRLANYFGLDSETDLKNSIKKLCSSLCGGSTIFIEVKNLDSVIDQEKFLDWFFKEFWQPVINELRPTFVEFSQIRFILALVAKSKLTPDCSSLSTYFCKEDTFEPCKAIELPLPDWTVDDIDKWLIKFRGLSNRDSKKLALQIHRESEGTPDTICSILERKFGV
ncbi:MAG: hypothetical protein F6K14_29675 [Symploca sp. SIO2C1]|nr:hypothetical protein [Symploca sp. SIO2C1]